MPTYTLPDLERHWEASVRTLVPELPSCHAFFEQLPKTASTVTTALAGRRLLAANCAYLLLAKSLNHAFATYVLLQRGLLVDAALTVRNALETLMLLELLSLRTDLCDSWSSGKEIKPSEVRKYLAGLSTVGVGELVITVSEDEYADAKVAYMWLSRITHANLESLNHATTRVDEDGWVLHIGGARFSVQARALSKILGVSFLRALITCTAVHAPQLLKSDRARFTKLKQLVAAVSVSDGA